MITCIEMVPLSLFFHYAYSHEPYILSKNGISSNEAYPPQGRSYQGGFLGIRAFIVMWNPIDILRAIAFGFKMATLSRQHSTDAENGAQAVYHPLNDQTMRPGRISADAQRLLDEAPR
jgi:hypothetical protein